MTIKKEPDDNIYCHQAPGYPAKIVKLAHIRITFKEIVQSV